MHIRPHRFFCFRRGLLALTETSHFGIRNIVRSLNACMCVCVLWICVNCMSLSYVYVRMCVWVYVRIQVVQRLCLFDIH